MDADIRHSALSNAVRDVLQDVWDLGHKEFQFARGEFSAKVDALVRKVIWIAAAGLFAVIALGLLGQAAIFAMAEAGWRCTGPASSSAGPSRFWGSSPTSPGARATTASSPPAPRCNTSQWISEPPRST
jgi:hypothetical protein